MTKKSLSATQLRLVLSISLIIIALLQGGIFAFAYNHMTATATEVSHTVVDANASQNNLTTLEKIKNTLSSEKDVVERAQSIVAESQSYQYQNQIITDLNGFAARNNVAITNVDFTSSTTPAANAPATATTPTAPIPTGLKSTSVVVTLKTPVDYNNLLRFIASIEQNLTKMQISKVALSKGQSTDSEIMSDALTIEVYIR
jgi:hypothetical protein